MTENDEDRPGWGRRIAIVAGGLALLGTIAAIVRTLDGSPPPARIRPPPVVIVELPPPPLPEPEPEPEVEPAPEEQAIEETSLPDPAPAPEPVAEPEPQAAESPAAPGESGIDAEGEGGGDSFGLRASKGGSGLFGNGGGGGGSYAGWVESRLRQALTRETTLRGTRFKVELKISVDAAGRLTHVTWVRRSGDPELDQKILQALKKHRELGSPGSTGEQGIIVTLDVRPT